VFGEVSAPPQPATPTTIAPEAGEIVNVATEPASTTALAGPMLPLGLARVVTEYRRGLSDPPQPPIANSSDTRAIAGAYENLTMMGTD
jgi:hypothetical protein